MLRHRAVVVAMSLTFAAAGAVGNVGCATARNEPAPPPVVTTPPAANDLDAPPIAVRPVDAPGFSVTDLTAAVRDAVHRTSGVPVVDEMSVRAELASCEQAPCPDTQAQMYKRAAWVLSSSVSRIGDVFLATVHIEASAREVVRVTTQNANAARALEDAGYQAGDKLRSLLKQRGRVLESTGGATDDGTTR